MAKHEVQYVELSGGRQVPAALLVCPQCGTLDLKLELDTSTQPWTAWCSKGHEFTIDARENA